MNTILSRIIDKVREGLEERRRRTPFEEIEARGAMASSPRNFMDAFLRHDGFALFAEIKFASPSAGTIRQGGDPCYFARIYEMGGASAVSVLTEPHFFKGDLSYLDWVKKSISLPILQKDFIVDPYQIYEGRAYGADGILLIAAILDRQELREYVELATRLRMMPLVEIHDEDDLEKISPWSLPLIGINNRNLKTFEVDLATTLRLRMQIPREIRVISESGIKSPQDVKRLRNGGVDGILVGESLMRSPDPISTLKGLLSE